MEPRSFDNRIPDNDRDKFNMACELLAGQMMEQGMPQEIARIAAYTIVCDAMDATERHRKRVAKQWEMFSAVHYN